MNLNKFFSESFVFMIMIAKRRLEMEYQKFRKDPPELCSAMPREDTIFYWDAIIEGPKGTPYEGGFFKLCLKFEESYPFNPPNVEFITRIFHPNVSSRGKICVDILDSEWSPIISVSKLLISLCSLLSEPNFEDPLVSSIGR